MACKRTDVFQRALSTKEKGRNRSQRIQRIENYLYVASKRCTTVAFRLTRGQRNSHTVVGKVLLLAPSARSKSECDRTMDDEAQANGLVRLLSMESAGAPVDC